MKGTPLDFTKPRPISERINEVGGNPTGYDHNFVINGKAGEVRLAARMYDPGSGRMMEIHTTQPGIQFYDGNLLDASITGKGGRSTSNTTASARKPSTSPTPRTGRTSPRRSCGRARSTRR